MNVVIPVLFAEPGIRIIIDVLMVLSVCGAALLMILVLLGQANPTSGKRAAMVKLVPAPVSSRRSRHGASLHPWELSCAGGATRAPPRNPPIQQAPVVPTSPGVAAPVVRLGARC